MNIPKVMLIYACTIIIVILCMGLMIFFVVLNFDFSSSEGGTITQFETNIKLKLKV